METFDHDEPPCSEEVFRPDRDDETTEVAAPRWDVGKPPAGTPGGRTSLSNEETSRTPGRTENSTPPTGGGTGKVREL